MAAVHDDHRARMRRRFLEHGLDVFQDHETLELLLFYSVPRADTNPTAHRLMERFGSLHAVLEAPPRELAKVEGVGEASATLLHYSMELIRRYALDKRDHDMPRACLNSTELFGQYLRPFFIGRGYELAMLVCLDSRGGVLCSEQIAGGTVGEVHISARRIAEIALSWDAYGVLLAHNHPGGKALPSVGDRETTAALETALGGIGIRLVDHLIFGEPYDVTGADFVSMLESGYIEKPR